MKKYELDLNEINIKQTIEENVLKRNEKLVNLIKLFNNINENYIISIDGSWGCGKTFFIQQLIYMSKNYKKISILNDKQRDEIREFSDNHCIVYYNAWINDDHIKPLDSIIYNILNEFPKYNNDIISKQEIFELIKESLMSFIEKSSFEIITAENLKNVKTFEDLAKSIHTIEEKKESLNKLLKLIAKDSRILLVIDELDRCKPNFAVQMLETIKHFYNNPNITILVVTNNKQLAQTIKHFYGNEFDGYGYLNKIYDSVITLNNDYIEEYARYYCKIIESTHLPEDFSVLLFKYFDFSYREINKYMSMYRIVEPYTNYQTGFLKNNPIVESCIFLPLALAIKIKNVELYDNFVKGTAESLLIKIFNKNWIQQQSERYYDWFCEIFHIDESEDLSLGVVREYKKIFSKDREYFSFPYMEAISMLGNMINLRDD